jgi:uroporphyrinogen-III decarboxylase
MMMDQKLKQVFKNNYFSFQKGAQRLEYAMQGIPDQIPVYAQIHEFTMNELGIPAKTFYTTPEILTPATLEITERYGIDVGFVDYDVYNIEAEGMGQEVIYFEDHVPDVDRRVPLITGPDDLEKIRTPDFNTAGRFNKVIEIQLLYAKLTGLPPALQFCAPFSLAANIRGVEELIMDMLRNPDFARGLFDAIVEEVLAPWILYQKEQFPNATSIAGADAMASLPILNLKMLEEWVAPYILKLREICGPEVYVPNWVGERYLDEPEEMLALKLQVSPDFLEGQDPDVNALGPASFKQFAEDHNVPLVLGVGAEFLGVGAEFLAHATPEEVGQRVREYVKVGGENGRFALYLCNLGATTPPENLRAAIEAVKSVPLDK